MTNHKYVISDFAQGFDFEDMRAFHDFEVQAIADKLIMDPMFMRLANYIWPEMTFEQVKEKTLQINSSIDFQLQFMHGAIRRIVEMSSSGLSCNGFEHLDPNKSYLFIANHRDILLDAAILQILLVEHGFPTSEITFGSNLMEKGFITDFGKLNRMFTVVREGTSKELYEISRKLSAYIRHTIVDRKISVWISQRNGRTKDGFDETQGGLLKMLNISGTGDFSTNFSQLNVVPLTISYEYEPCDDLKTQELYYSTLHTKYSKSPGEDLNSILTGIRQFKGRIHLAVGNPLDDHELKHVGQQESENDKIKALSNLLDKKIHRDYKLSTVNYIACDMLQQTNVFEANYTEKEKQDFIHYMNSKISSLVGEPDILREIFLKIYGQPTVNKLHLTGH